MTSRDLTSSELSNAIETGRLDPNFIDQDATSPLIASMHMESPELVASILAAGADPNLKMPDGDYPLQVAYRYALHHDVGYRYLDALLAHGANLNRQFFPPLHGACHAGDLRLVRYLIEHGADTAFYDGDENLPVDWARRSTAAEAMFVLLDTFSTGGKACV